MYGKQKSKQRTLSQVWNKGLAPGTTELSVKLPERQTSSKSNVFSAQQAAKMVSDPADLTDDDLIEAAEFLESTMNDIPGPSNVDVEHISGFDNSLGNLWIYPTNYPVRDYQFSIVKNALMKNTLVSLPTGLGKTFIGAVVMYNFYRWYPQGKIIFMAPTKPLVSQQIEACYNIMGIPLDDQVEITGMTTPVHKREALWSSKRVFFLTPQVISNDLARGVCPAEQIKCVVIDEAHKAQGKHAYCQVINQLISCTHDFRVLALSATPGTDVKSVQQKYEMGAIEGDFATCISLLHGLELLQQHGMRSFFIFIKAMMDKGNVRAKSVLGTNPLFRELYQNLTSMFGPSPNSIVSLTQAGQTQQSMQKVESSTQSSNYVYSHPKIAKLEEVVVQHFRSFSPNNENDTTRVMVFCQYRDSVQEITELLQNHRPLIKPMQFVGHSSASGKLSKFTQKDQLQVVSKFRAGGYNTLISTCVGEEGLDIGDVDLIVCFDAHKSPIRLVQRMGRTGRKRKGRIVMLVTEGKEERDYNSSLSNKMSIQNAITGNSGRSLQFYRNNPRMIPSGLNPKPLKMHMTVKDKSEAQKDPTKTNKRKPRKTENADISLIMKNAENRNSVFLNSEQVKEWDEKLKLSAREKKQLKLLPSVSHIHCLGGGKVNSLPERPRLSLSEWTLWQTRLQDSKLSGHSSTTNNFVEVMEVCDLIKQSDDQNFDENLAPFLGANYNKSKMESGKLSNKLDGYVTPVLKTANYLTKEQKLSKIIAEALGKKDSPQKLTVNDDFMLENPKKIFPERNTFKYKFSLLADDKDSENLAKDETLNGIESILFDDQDIIVESSNENLAKRDWKPPIIGTNHALPECLPAFHVDDFNMDHYQSTSRPSKIEKQKKAADNKRETKNECSQETEKFKKNDHGLGAEPKTCDQYNPLLDFVNNLSMVPTQTQNKKNSGCAVGRPPTPPLFDSISLDFMDDFGSDVSDAEESTKKVKSPKRACFLLGSGSNDTGEITTAKNDEKSCQSHVIPPQSAAEMLSDIEMSITTNPPQTKDKDNDLNSIGFALDRSGYETNDDTSFVAANMSALSRCEKARNIVPVDDNFEVTDHEKPKNQLNFREATNRSLNIGIECMTSGKQLAASTSLQSHSVSVDMFAPQFDIDFDLTGFEDEEIGKDVNSSLNSPVLASKKKNDNGGETGARPRNADQAESSLAHLMLSQRFDNQAVFPDWRKIHSGTNVPVAEVKPQRLGNISVGANEEIGSFVESGINLVQQEPDAKQFASKRKMVADCPENASSNRIKNTEYAGFTSPRILTKTPKTEQSLRTYEDSPLIKRKRPLQSKKLLFSPDNGNSQKYTSTSEGENEDSLKLIATEREMISTKRSERSKYRDAESPLIPYKKAFHDHPRYNHSTPKYVRRSMIPIDPSDDDDFEESIKGTTKNQERVVKNPITYARKKVFRSQMQDFIDDEAEVSDDGVKVSSDEDETIDREELKIMRDFVNDATILTQHVTDGRAIDEQAMYLRRNPDFFEEERQPNGKFKLAYGVGNDMDVFSQEVSTDVSGYEEDSFVCDDVKYGDDPTALGDVTLLDELPCTDGRKPRITRRQAELKKLQQMNYDAPFSTHTIPKVEKMMQKVKPTTKRILCFDDSTDSTGSSQKSQNPNPQVQEEKLCESNPESWSCPACALMNKSTSRLCELCDCEKPNSTEQNTATISETWTCKSCVYLNRKKVDMCDMCGEPLHKNTQQKATENSSKLKLVEQRGETKIKSVNKSSSSVSSSDACEFNIIPATPIATENRPGVKKRLAMFTPNSSVEIAKDSILQNSLSASSQLSGGSSFSSANNEEREARMKRCKEKQMAFRARMGKRCSGQPTSLSTTEKVSAPTNSKTPVLSSMNTSLQLCTPDHGSSDLINSSLVSPIVQEERTDKNVVLVDSKELSGSQPIITTLRCKHNVHVTVASLPSCGYIIGRGTAVERKVVSDMSQVSNRPKLVARIQQLNRNYDRVYLIIEQDRVKKRDLGRSDGRPVHSNCYTSTVCALSLTNVRILYSDNQDNTASILVMLAAREKRLKREIDLAAAEKANDANYRSLLRLYSSIPKVSYVSALYMCLNLKNFKEAASSSVEKLIQKAHLSTCAAAEVYIFFRRSFDLQMTPAR